MLYTGLYFIALLKISALNIVAFFLVNFVFINTMYQAKWRTALFHSAITTAIMGMSELVLYSFMPHFIPDFFAENSSFRNIIILTVFSKTLYLLILFGLSQIFKRKHMSKHHGETSIYLICVSIITIFVMWTLFVMCEQSKLSDTFEKMISFSAVLLLVNNILIFAINNRTHKKNLEFTEMQLLLQKEYDSTEYYKMLSQQTENQSILIHDIKQHLHSIAMLNQNYEHEKIATYIKEITLSCGFHDVQKLCDNEMLNTILCRYKRQCTDLNISFVTDIRRNSVNFITNNDLTSLFCNLLDNALESASKMSNSVIEINVNKTENSSFTVLTMTNSCRTSPFNAKNDNLITNKPDKLRHGFGLKSIRKIVKKYNGDIKMYYDAESLSFHTIITLKG
jgi:hypothetical protein